MTDATASVLQPPSGIGRWIKEPFCGLSHGIAAVASVAGLVLLLVLARDSTRSVVGVSVYGGSMFALYFASFLVHSVHCSPRVENILERLDYAAIFFLIAGTYTPVCLTTLSGAWGWSILGTEAGLAVFGATMVLIYGPRRVWVALYLPMGWMVLVAAAPLLHRMDTLSIVFLLAGGVIYSVGAVVFLLDRPKLWPGRFGSHDLWHVMVMAGSACHFAVVMRVT